MFFWEWSELGSDQPVFRRDPNLFTKSVEVPNKGFNWPVCAELRCPKEIWMESENTFQSFVKVVYENHFYLLFKCPVKTLNL